MRIWSARLAIGLGLVGAAAIAGPRVVAQVVPPNPADSVRDSVRMDSLALDVADTTAAGPGAADPPRGPVRLVATVSGRRLYIVHGTDTVRSYPIAVGKSTHPTPRGTFRVRRIIFNPAWTPPPSPWARGLTPKKPGQAANPMQGAKIFFREPYYYIHGTNAPGSIGKAESHGCIRMHPDHVVAVARYVMENGGEPQEEGWFTRVLNMRWRERHVHMRNPIEMIVKS